MHFLKSLVKYLLFFMAGVIVAAFATATAVSFYAVDHLMAVKPAEKVSEKTKPKSKTKAPVIDEDVPPEDTYINSNIVEVLRMGDQYRAELSQFDELQSKIVSHKSPPLCDVLCSASSFDSERMLQERTPYLQEFYRQNGERSMRDPFFQLKLREVGFLSEIFPTSIRSLWHDVEQKRDTNPTLSQKLSWSLQFEMAALKELYRLSGKWDDLKKESDRIQGLRELIQSCQKGLRPAKDLRTDCQHL